MAVMMVVTALASRFMHGSLTELLDTFLQTFLAWLRAAFAVGIAEKAVAVAAATDATPAFWLEVGVLDFTRGLFPLYRLDLSCKYSQFAPFEQLSNAKYLHGILAFCSLVSSGLSPLSFAPLPSFPLPLPFVAAAALTLASSFFLF